MGANRRESERRRSAWVSGYGLALLYGFSCGGGYVCVCVGGGYHTKLIKCSHLGSSRAAAGCPRLNRGQHLEHFCRVERRAPRRPSSQDQAFNQLLFCCFCLYTLCSPSLALLCRNVCVRIRNRLYKESYPGAGLRAPLHMVDFAGLCRGDGAILPKGFSSPSLGARETPTGDETHRRLS